MCTDEIWKPYHNVTMKGEKSRKGRRKNKNKYHRNCKTLISIHILRVFCVHSILLHNWWRKNKTSQVSTPADRSRYHLGCVGKGFGVTNSLSISLFSCIFLLNLTARLWIQKKTQTRQHKMVFTEALLRWSYSSLNSIQYFLYKFCSYQYTLQLHKLVLFNKAFKSQARSDNIVWSL